MLNMKSCIWRLAAVFAFALTPPAQARELVLAQGAQVDKYLAAEKAIKTHHRLLGMRQLQALVLNPDTSPVMRQHLVRRIKSIRATYPQFFWSASVENDNQSFATDTMLITLNGQQLPFTVSRKTDYARLGTLSMGMHVFDDKISSDDIFDLVTVQHTLMLLDDHQSENDLSLKVHFDTGIDTLLADVEVSAKTASYTPEKVGSAQLGFKHFLAPFEAISLTLEGGTKFSQKSPSATKQWFERAEVAYERPLGRMNIKGSHQWYAVPSRDFAYHQTTVDLSLPRLPWQVYPTLTASHFKFQGDTYPFGVPRKEVIKKLRLSKSFHVFGKVQTYVEYVENTSNIDVYSYNEIGFGFLFGQ